MEIKFIISACCFIAGCFLFFKSRKNNWIKWTFSTFFLLWLIATTIHWTAYAFTGKALSESFLYHISTGVKGAGFEAYTGLILSLGVFICAGIILLYWMSRCRQHAKSKTHLPCLVFICFAFYSHPTIANWLHTVHLKNSSSINSPPEHVHQDSVRFSGPAKNIVFIYLEGFERTYMNEALFPNLAPNLQALEKKALSFTRINQTFGTNWTIAGMVASQCGIPLVTPSNGNLMSGLDQFLPKARCLGDFLSSQEYTLSYMGGADLHFAGKGTFYATHGFTRIQGWNKLLPTLPAETPYSDWGLHDDTLISLATKELDMLAEQKQPFGFFTLTLDTHSPDGRLSPSCKNLRYADGQDPMLNAVHCSDRLIGQWMRKLMQRPWAENTIFVLASDHLAMKNTAWDKLQSTDRHNLFMIFSPQDAKIIHKPGTTLDILPTVTSLIGGQSTNSIGFGRNLLDEAPTLYEQKTNLYGFLEDNRSFLSSLWDYPQLTGGLSFDPSKQILNLGERKMQFPALLSLTSDLEVKTLYFEFHSSLTLPHHLLSFKPDQKFAWIDQCAKMASAISLRPSLIPERPNQWCLSAGQLNATSIPVWSIEQDSSISFDAIQEAFEKLPINSNEISFVRKQRLSFLHHYRMVNLPSYTYSFSANPSQSMVLIASSDHEVPAVVETYNQGVRADEQNIQVPQGLSIIEYDEAQTPHIIYTLKSCNTDPTIDFSSILQKNGMLISHGKVRCTQEQLAKLLEQTSLKQWQVISKGYPYIALFNKHQVALEFAGNATSLLALHITAQAP